MNKLLKIIALLFLGSAAYAAGNSDPTFISTGTSRGIDTYANVNGAYRQAVVWGDSTSSATVSVDAVTGANVHLSSSAAEIGNVKNSGTFATQSTLQISTNNIGTVSGSSVTVTNGNIAVTGSVTANAGTNLNTSALALESGGNLATLAGAISGGKVQDNVAQINGATPLMGNGVTGTGSPRVTVSADNTAFAVNLTTSVVNTIGGYLVCTSTFANVAASQTAQVLLGAVASTTFRVMSFHAVAGGTATNLTFNSNSTAISPLYANAANGGLVVNYSPLGHFQTNSGESLTVTTGAGSTTGINISYCKF